MASSALPPLDIYKLIAIGVGIDSGPPRCPNPLGFSGEVYRVNNVFVANRFRGAAELSGPVPVLTTTHNSKKRGPETTSLIKETPAKRYSPFLPE